MILKVSDGLTSVDSPCYVALWHDIMASRHDIVTSYDIFGQEYWQEGHDEEGMTIQRSMEYRACRMNED